jgi:hypothetical protein
MMKKLFFLFAMIASVAASAQVTFVELLSANYTNKTVTFRVWWNAGSRNDTHLSKVWVWVDYIKVNSNNTTSGNSWTRAEISTVSGGATSYDGSNRKGFWLEGNASTNYSATLTAQLNITETKFNWCAYVSDYPPNATMANGTYTLKGTPPFTINGTITENGKKYSGACITSLTDATACPGIISYSAFSAGALGNGSWGSMGEFLNVGGTPLSIVSTTAASGGSGKITYKWFKNNVEISGATATTYLPPKTDAASAGTFNYTRKSYDGVCNTAGTTASGTWKNIVGGPASTVTGCNIAVAMYDLTKQLNWSDANAACSSLGSGWRLPTGPESQDCLCTYRKALNLKLTATTAAYWLSTIVTNINNSGDPNCCCGQATYGMLHVAEPPSSGWGGLPCSSADWTWCPTVATVYVRCVRNK